MKEIFIPLELIDEIMDDNNGFCIFNFILLNRIEASSFFSKKGKTIFELHITENKKLFEVTVVCEPVIEEQFPCEKFKMPPVEYYLN